MEITTLACSSVLLIPHILNLTFILSVNLSTKTELPFCVFDWIIFQTQKLNGALRKIKSDLPTEEPLWNSVNESWVKALNFFRKISRKSSERKTGGAYQKNCCQLIENKICLIDAALRVNNCASKIKLLSMNTSF